MTTPSRRTTSLAGAATVLRTVTSIESGSPACSAAGSSSRVIAASAGYAGERDGVERDAAFARRGGEAERFAGRLPTVGEEDDAAAARGPRQRHFERSLEVRLPPFEAARGFARQHFGPRPGEFGAAAELDDVAVGAAAFVGLEPGALGFGRAGADAERAVEHQRRRRWRGAGGRVEEGDGDEDEARRLEAEDEAPAARAAAQRLAPERVGALEDEHDERRDQEPLPEVGVAGVDGRRRGREVDRGARGRGRPRG